MVGVAVSVELIFLRATDVVPVGGDQGAIVGRSEAERYGCTTSTGCQSSSLTLEGRTSIYIKITDVITTMRNPRRQVATQDDVELIKY